MARKSSIERLPAPLKQRLHKLVRDGKLTLDEMIDSLREEFGAAPSRSALGRWTQRFEETVAKQREMEAVTEIWVREFKDNPTSKTGRMVLELLRTVAMQSAMTVQGKDHVDPRELAHLARAFNLIEAGGKRNVELEREIRTQVRDELLAEQAKVIDKVSKTAGLSADTADALRRQILGIA